MRNVKSALLGATGNRQAVPVKAILDKKISVRGTKPAQVQGTLQPQPEKTASRIPNTFQYWAYRQI